MSGVKIDDPIILNVDDYLPGRYARTKILQQVGYPVREAGTGEEALEMAARLKPALILLDVNLPDIHGFEVCRRLRTNPETASITIVHISASSVLTQHQVYGLDVGADGYIVEPVEPAVLIATVSAFLRARKAEEQSRRASDELRWFSYRVGHDLNEPLRTIAMYSQLLKARVGGLDPESTGFLQFIGDATSRMKALLDGLLQYSETTAAENKIGPVDCELVLSRIVSDLDSVVHNRGARITHGSLPTVMANEQLGHVFQNLITNAIKYSRPDTTPEIHVSAVEESGTWRFAVRDNGLGIEPEFREGIFEIFKRLHGRDIPGNGIGLALARKIVEAHGGVIWVESEPKQGSTFFFTIPASLPA